MRSALRRQPGIPRFREIPSLDEKGPRRLLRAGLCIANFRSRLGDRDWFDDWGVGRQFVPECLHHPVVGLKLPSAFSHLLRRNAGFSQYLRVSGLVSAG